MFEGIVSLLRPEYEREVVELWSELEDRFGFAIEPPIPHFSYHVAHRYNAPATEEALAAIARTTRKFTVRTNGIAAFPGEHPVLYIAIDRQPELDQLHRTLWSAASLHALEIVDYYHPDRWVPHITLAMQGLTNENFSSVSDVLRKRTFTWTMEIESIGIIYVRNDRNVRGPQFDLCL